MKSIPSQLITHKALPVTTLCRLLKIKCRNGTMFGFANLDEDLTFDDDQGDGSPSDGPLLYRSANGFVPSRIAYAAGTSIDNAEMTGITVDIESLGITEHQIRSGLLDYAEAVVYEVNYLDLTTGRCEVVGFGKAGRVSMQGDEFKSELRSLMQLFRQPLGEVTSITCRARFGDERCGKAFTWSSGAVTTASGSEPDRIFRVASLANTAGFYVPGVVRFDDGENEGVEVEVEDFAADGTFVLALPVYYTIPVGVNISARQDCSKDWDDDAHGCKYHWTTLRALHFRGEPKIPLGQEGALSTPGAEL